MLSARRESELQKVKEQCLGRQSSLLGIANRTFGVSFNFLLSVKFLEKSRKAGRVIAESDIFILPFDITKLEVHKQHFDSVLQHFGSVRSAFQFI